MSASSLVATFLASPVASSVVVVRVRAIAIMGRTREGRKEGREGGNFVPKISQIQMPGCRIAQTDDGPTMGAASRLTYSMAMLRRLTHLRASGGVVAHVQKCDIAKLSFVGKPN